MKEYMSVIHSIEEFERIIQNDRICIFVFSANWCPDCRFIEPFMPDVVDTFSSYDFYYVDRDECLDLCQTLGVMGIPSFVAYKDGNEIGRFVSKFRKTKVEIESFLSSLSI